MNEQDKWLGRPVSALPMEEIQKVTVTAAPVQKTETRRDGALRLIGYRDGRWIAAAFSDGLPKRKDQ